MRPHHVDCPYCGSRVDLGSRGPEHDTPALCPKCLQTVIVGPVADGYEARIPRADFPGASTAGVSETLFSGRPSEASVPLDAGGAEFSSYLDALAAGTSESTWTAFHPFRVVVRATLRAAAGGVFAIAGPLNVWRQAMADHPVKTMVSSFVVAAGISAMLMAMWLIVLALIRARS
jgi:hypothetical protein